MLRWITALGASAAFLLVSGGAPLHADRRGLTLVVTMTNDPDLNLIKVYDADTHALLQTLSTRGKGGVGEARLFAVAPDVTSWAKAPGVRPRAAAVISVRGERRCMDGSGSYESRSPASLPD